MHELIQIEHRPDVCAFYTAGPVRALRPSSRHEKAEPAGNANRARRQSAPTILPKHNSASVFGLCAKKRPAHADKQISQRPTANAVN